MIYVCIPSYNDAKTVGLVLWKVRQIFAGFPREYQLLVADDGSSDTTAELLATYERVLPLTVLSHPARQGHAASVEDLLRHALRLTDRPKRDSAVILPSDFSVSPNVLPDLIRRFESGADVVVAEAPADVIPIASRLVRRVAPWLLKPGLAVPDIRDPLTGVLAVRLITLKRCLQARDRAVLTTEGRCANAELLARAAAYARQIASVPIAPPDLRPGPQPEHPFALALQLYRAGRSVRIPKPEIPSRRAS